MKAAVPNGIREKSQLLARAAGNGHEVQLRRLGKARRDQDFMPGGMPVGKARAAKRRITSRCFRQRTRNFGNPVNYQAFRGCDVGVLCHGRKHRQGLERHQETVPFHPGEPSVKRKLLYTPSPGWEENIFQNIALPCSDDRRKPPDSASARCFARFANRSRIERSNAHLRYQEVSSGRLNKGGRCFEICFLPTLAMVYTGAFF